MAVYTGPDYTSMKYAQQWGRFKRWCEHFGHQALPASPRTVHEFLSTCYSMGIFKQARAAIRRAHYFAGYKNSPTDHPSIKRLAKWYAKYKPFMTREDIRVHLSDENPNRIEPPKKRRNRAEAIADRRTERQIARAEVGFDLETATSCRRDRIRWHPPGSLD